MIPKLIRLGVENVLKIICEKIIIKNIEIIDKDKKLNRKIDKLFIKAESIIFNKINISNIIINLKDVIIRFKFNKKIFFIENCDASIHMRLSKDNINKTLCNKKWKNLKTSIESFISKSFNSIDINDKLIYFISSDGLWNTNIYYSLQYDKNTISLVNTITQEKFSILNDKNIIINNLFFYENYIEVELSSKIIFN